MKHRNLFWGLFFIAAACFVIAGSVGVFVHLGFWSIAATVLLAAVLISGFVQLDFFTILLPVALLYLIYQKPLGFVELPVWVPIAAAVLAGLGLNLLFHRGCHHGPHGGHSHFGSHGENTEGNEIYARVRFAESSRYLHADGLKRADLSVSFGRLLVYFDQVRLDPAGAEVQLSVRFGEMVLFVPKGFRVVNRVVNNMGAVQTAPDEPRQPDASSPELTLSGSIAFGNLNITYV